MHCTRFLNIKASVERQPWEKLNNLIKSKGRQNKKNKAHRRNNPSLEKYISFVFYQLVIKFLQLKIIAKRFQFIFHSVV